MGVGHVASFVLALGVLCAGDWVCAARGHVLVRAGQLLDVKTGHVLVKQTLLIVDGKVQQVGPHAEVEKSAVPNAQVVDLGNFTVLPGLIDTHTHLTYRNNVASSEWLSVSAPREALIGVQHARLTLMAGFTTVRNLGARGFSDVALRDSINAGEVLGPRMLVSGPAMGSTGGHMDSNLLPYAFRYSEEGVADGKEGVLRKVRELVKYGADVIKVAATGGFLSVGTNPDSRQYSDEELSTLVTETHRLGRKVAAHAHGAGGIKQALRAGVDSIEHGTEIDDECIQMMKTRGTFLVPTLHLWSLFHKDASFPGVPPDKILLAQKMQAQMRQNIARAHNAGVKFAFGTDSSVYPHGENGREFRALVQVGLSPLAAIRAATIHAAELLGRATTIGQLQPGFFGDLIAVPQNPLSDVSVLENIPFVMKEGEIVKDLRSAHPCQTNTTPESR